MLDVGFTPRQHGIGKGAPGNVFAARPDASARGYAKLILPFDDDELLYIYTKFIISISFNVISLKDSFP